MKLTHRKRRSSRAATTPRARARVLLTLASWHFGSVYVGGPGRLVGKQHLYGPRLYGPRLSTTLDTVRRKVPVGSDDGPASLSIGNSAVAALLILHCWCRQRGFLGLKQTKAGHERIDAIQCMRQQRQQKNGRVVHSTTATSSLLDDTSVFRCRGDLEDYRRNTADIAGPMDRSTVMFFPSVLPLGLFCHSAIQYSTQKSIRN